MDTDLPLANCRIAMIIAAGYHEHEFWFPFYRFREAGATVTVAAPKAGEIPGEGRHGTDGLIAKVPNSIEQIAGEDFDALYIPGGIYSPLELRTHTPAIELTRRMAKENRIVAAICHGPWLLISAGLAKGRKIACPEDMADDVTNAGGTWAGQSAVQDGNLITAYSYRYLPDHFRLLMPALINQRRGG